MTDSGQRDRPGKKEEGGVAEALQSGGARRHERRLGDVGQESGPPIWLITFTDVMGLMLTFFVMMFAMAEPEQKNWNDITAALNNEFSRFYGRALERGPSETINLERIDFDQALDVKYLNALLESIMKDNEQLSGVNRILQPGAIILSMPQDLLFEAGDAAIKADGARAIYALGGTLSRIRNKIQVIGHADPRPLSEGARKFESNWDLSIVRAANVAALLQSVGYERNVDVLGLSSGRYEDLKEAVPDEAARMDLARRVDIVIMDHDGRRTQQLFDIGAP